jgi:para-aminobenzoate synthetase
MSPMKGTLAKRPNMTREDAARELGTRKEEAENLMIVDLIRHDLTKALDGDVDAANAANAANVEVEKLFELVEAETVWQLISCVTGTVPAAEPFLPESRSEDETDRWLLRQRRRTLRHAMTALRATLPPGSMTGAPKKRSCEILRELERRNRGVYAGVLGYLDVGGGGAWSVAIRCAFEVKRKGKQNGGDKEGPQKLHVAAGGAITVLSDVEGEWEEMKVKMESVLKAFQ